MLSSLNLECMRFPKLYMLSVSSVYKNYSSSCCSLDANLTLFRSTVSFPSLTERCYQLLLKTKAKL